MYFNRLSTVAACSNFIVVTYTIYAYRPVTTVENNRRFYPQLGCESLLLVVDYRSSEM